MAACNFLSSVTWQTVIQFVSDIHWLPVRQRITFKLCVLAWHRPTIRVSCADSTPSNRYIRNYIYIFMFIYVYI